MKIDWNLWKPRLLYGGFFTLAFLVALRWTFPAEAVKERLILEAAAQGWQLDAGEVGAAGILGISARNVALEDRSGRKFGVESFSAALRILPLLVGKRTVSFDLGLWDGRVRGTADLSGAERRYTAELDRLDLASAAPLRKASGLELLGALTGSVDVTIPEDAKGKPRGSMRLQVKDAGLNGGQVEVPAMGGSLSLPKVSLGELSGEFAFEDGRGNVKRLETKGGDAELQAEGLYFVWQPRLEFAPIFGRARMRVQDVFWSKSGAGGFRSIAEVSLAPAKGRDGTYQFQIYGTLGHPQARPLASAQQP